MVFQVTSDSRHVWLLNPEVIQKLRTLQQEVQRCPVSKPLLPVPFSSSASVTESKLSDRAEPHMTVKWESPLLDINLPLLYNERLHLSSMCVCVCVCVCVWTLICVCMTELSVYMNLCVYE